jgi:hypothetical protein
MRETAAVRIWTGQFNIIAGDVREEGPNVASFEGRATDGDPATLYVLAEPALPASEPLVGEMVQAIGQLFRQQDVSLTGNLLRSLRGAHESLYQWNQDNDRSVWSAAGCSAAVVRGQDVFLAQCGPAVAYYRGAGGGIKQIVPDSAARAAIGVADHFRPSLTRHALRAGDTLLLARSVLLDLASDQQIGELLALSPEDALPQLYLLAKAQQEFSLLLLAGLAAPELGGEVAGRARPRAAPAPPSRRNPFGR